MYDLSLEGDEIASIESFEGAKDGQFRMQAHKPGQSVVAIHRGSLDMAGRLCRQAIHGILLFSWAGALRPIAVHAGYEW